MEKAASKYIEEDFHERSKVDFKAGAKWQKQQIIKKNLKLTFEDIKYLDELILYVYKKENLRDD